MTTTNFTITGMHCDSCKALIEDMARDVPGVESCAVNQEQHTGKIEHDERFDFTAFAKEIGTLGKYTVVKI